MEQGRQRNRALGRGYRAKIRQLAALGMTKAGILEAMPGLTLSELNLTLALSAKRGRPLKRTTIHSITDVKRWRAIQRPRTMRAALECVDFLLRLLEQRDDFELHARDRQAPRKLPGFT